jgi:dipeptidyl aminopeptidase/acylaminoacyl peptidase
VARAKVSLSELCSDGDALYWLESRPAEAGRVVFVRAGTDGPRDHSPPGVSIRSRVHEYGGGAVCLLPGNAGSFAYVDQAEQRVWACGGAGEAPRPLTAPAPDGELHNHGGLSATPDGKWVLAVREVHPADDARPRRSVVALPVQGGAASTIVEGHDFFGSPRPHPGGGWLAVVAWEHPDMPWDASRLLVVPVTRARGEVPALVAGAPVAVAGGPDESVGQPAWCADGTLRFVSDRSGWWQPYVVPVRPGRSGDGEGGGGERDDVSIGAARPLAHEAAEFHGPDWVLAQSTTAELADGRLVARKTSAGRDAVVALAEGVEPAPVEQPCVSISALCAHGDGFALIGSTPGDPVDVWLCRSPGDVVTVRPGAGRIVPVADVSRAEPFSTIGRRGRPVHGTLYRPTLGGTRPEPGAIPPLVVWCHGGPTSACSAGLDLVVQFFTTRGFAVACVDYAGSSGYGRAYRCALWGEWGVADAEDCLDAALHLAAQGEADPERMAVRGGSAGGMTALNALASGEGFAACTSLYGVTDLLALAATTHDFEAHYTDRLIGPLPEARARYVTRSPVSRASAMGGSVLLLQGTEDAVVPPAQAELMRDALVAAGVDCDLRFFEGEGHGFRRAETLAAVLEAELASYLEHLRL